MFRQKKSPTKDVGLLAMRAITGGLLAGHGAQKLFGVLGGYGLEGTSQWIESLGLKPGKRWALMAGASEFGSGLLMALGLFTPVGSIAALGPMAMAWATVHAGKPIWVTSGGAELPLMNMAAATALALLGPGEYSLDEALDIEVPLSIIALTGLGVAAGLAAGLLTRKATPEAQANLAGGEQQTGEDAVGSGAEIARAVGE